MNKLYRNKYIIALYDKFDDLITVLNNEYEFAEYMGISINASRVALSELFNHHINYVKSDGKRIFIYFILDIDEMWDKIKWLGGIMKLKSYLFNERKIRNLTQKELADKIGVSLPTYIKLENSDKADPSVKVVRKLASFFNITEGEIRMMK